MESRLSVMSAQVLHVGARERVTAHRTAAFKLVVGVDAELVLHHGHRSGRVRALLVPPMVTHALEAPGIAVGFFLPVESWGVAGATEGATRALELPDGARAATLVSWAREVSRDDGRGDPQLGAEAARLLGLPRGRPLDRRVGGTLRRLARFPYGASSELARAARLSPERLRHLVSSETGVPLREHRLFARTMRAVELLSRGRSIADAAMEAGFADHAHLTRTFRRCFGRTPSDRPARTLLHASFHEPEPAA